MNYLTGLGFIVGLVIGYLWGSKRQYDYYRGAINMAYRKGIVRGQNEQK